MVKVGGGVDPATEVTLFSSEGEQYNSNHIYCMLVSIVRFSLIDKLTTR